LTLGLDRNIRSRSVRAGGYLCRCVPLIKPTRTIRYHSLKTESNQRTHRCWRSSMVEQLICNQQVAGSIPIASSARPYDPTISVPVAPQPPTGQPPFAWPCLANVSNGGVPEWPKGTDCKSVVSDFEGSNPSPSTGSRIWTTASFELEEPMATPLKTTRTHNAGVAQLVELQPSKLDVAGSNPVSRSH
jgi:hypothetical protein